MPYDSNTIEAKWQRIWQDTGSFRVPAKSDKPKYYILDMFPYPSGHGLHVGHLKGYIASDILARYQRMRGYNVLHPMGWDSFGLPAERQAERDNLPPSEITKRNIRTFKAQMDLVGLTYDWEREFATSDPSYFRWTQWIFLKLFEMGLAYETDVPVNWCPALGTVLANEEVKDGVYIETGDPVERRIMRQWMLKITAYADRLLDDLDTVDWPEQVKELQRNWIGRSEGAEIFFEIEGYGPITVFTTRPDTLFGATFFVMSPEHPAVEQITTPERSDEVRAYVEKASRMSEIDRTDVTREKTGVFTGAYAINPANGERIPIYIADYVLMSYGTGAIMAVPAHDERDGEFARKYGIEIRTVIAPPDWNGEELDEPYVGEGTMVNSDGFDGTPSDEGREKVTAWLEERGVGEATVTYRLHDWLISRQRYWGTPIPMIFCDECGIVPVPEEDLPVLLPEEAEFMPTGESPLKLDPAFYNTECPGCGGSATRETDTMDTFMDSSWYWYRYLSPHYDEGPFDPERGEQWLPVDQYTGGIEHAILHLLYARFFTKVMRDLGLVDFDEPMTRLRNQGTILGPDGQKMSKSRGNVVNPQEYVDRFGSDALRCFLMFIGPWNEGGPWDGKGIEGVSRWLRRALTLVTGGDSSGGEADPTELERRTNRLIKKITEDLEAFRFNTSIAALMEHTNYLLAVRGRVGDEEWHEALRTFVTVLSPFAPHHAEEMWAAMGEEYSVHHQAWPGYEEDLIQAQEITLIVQVNGKLRDRIEAPADISEEAAKELALSSARVRPHLEGKELRKSIYVPGRLVNLVVG